MAPHSNTLQKLTDRARDGGLCASPSLMLRNPWFLKPCLTRQLQALPNLS